MEPEANRSLLAAVSKGRGCDRSVWDGKLGQKIRKHGLEQEQLLLPLFEEQQLFPNIRHDTIHQVKGESFGAVLVIGSAKFWNSVITAIIDGENNEDRRLAYVAMTRAKDLVMLSTPGTRGGTRVMLCRTDNRRNDRRRERP